MAMVLIEEVLCGMDEAKGLLDQAFFILAEVVEDMAPAAGPALQDACARALLVPLEACLGTLEALMDEMAT
jgi:hypothetical protein